MANNENSLADSGIRFFGKMSASSTHEIKNTLTIINESAGLIEDLCLMTEKGHPLSSTRINDISQRVTRQVKRTDLILRKLNRFSHSVDLSTQVADIEQTVLFVLDLASRLLEMQGVAVAVSPPLSPIMVDTHLFYFENILWRAIETGCLVAREEKQIKISFGTESLAPSIWFSMNMVKNNLMEDLFGSKEDRALLEHLDISIEKNNNGFGLLWSKQT